MKKSTIWFGVTGGLLIFALVTGIACTATDTWIIYSGTIPELGVLVPVNVAAGPWKITVGIPGASDVHASLDGCDIIDNKDSDLILELSSSDCSKWKTAKGLTVLNCLTLSFAGIFWGGWVWTWSPSNSLSPPKSRLQTAAALLTLSSPILVLTSLREFHEIEIFNMETIATDRGASFGFGIISILLAIIALILISCTGKALSANQPNQDAALLDPETEQS